jgi:polar amino acid transport system substrate-binding protein
MNFRNTLFLLLFPLALIAQDSIQKKISIGIKETPPFIIKNKTGGYSGLSVDLWQETAKSLNLEYTYQEYDLKGLINALENQEIDLCINPLTVTSERAKKFNFSQPFYITHLAIATGKEADSSILLFLENLFSLQFLKAVLLLFLVILVFGFLAWLFERKANPEEFEGGWKGIWSGIWWSAVTMTTVGYGDKSPRSTGGRIVALVWMFTAIIIISGFTASIASSLTVNQLASKISGPDDLKNFTVGTIPGSTSEKYMEDKGIQFSEFSSTEKGLQAIAYGEIDAFVYDAPILKYLVKNLGLENEVAILPHQFNTQYYSFSLPHQNQELLNRLNPVLLKEIEGVAWKATLNEYNLLE